MLIIKHKTGALAGQEHQFDGKADRIVFGRDKDASQVVFPADETLVSRRHFAIVRQPSGSYTIELFGAPFVAMDGVPASAGDVVRNGSTVELGRRGGPSFVVVIDEENTDSSMAKTQVQEDMAHPLQAALAAQKAASRARMFAITGVLAALAVGAGALWFYDKERRSNELFIGEIARLNVAQQEATAQRVSKEARDRLQAGAYLVIIHDEQTGGEWATGTAFPVGPHLLGTNAHVAKIRETLKPGQKLVVRGPRQTTAPLEVIDHKIHPGYTALEEFLDADPFLVQTIRTKSDSLGWDTLDIGNFAAYDVALLTVSGPEMTDILEVAPEAELRRLAAGDPLVYAGYPTESIVGSEVQQLAPTPNVGLGAVTALTDMFFLPADAAKSRLIHHSLSTAGGASGSPIISTSGRVVALNNAGTHLSDYYGRRIPLAGFAFAQRADFLVDLISGRAEANMADEKAYWEKQTANFKRGIEVLIPYMLDSERPSAEAKSSVIANDRVSLVSGEAVKYRDAKGIEKPSRKVTFQPSIQTGQRQTLVAYAEAGTPIKLYLLVDDKIVQKREGSQWYGAMSFTAEPGKKTEMVITGPDVDKNVQITNYAWQKPGT